MPRAPYPQDARRGRPRCRRGPAARRRRRLRSAPPLRKGPSRRRPPAPRPPWPRRCPAECRRPARPASGWMAEPVLALGVPACDRDQLAAHVVVRSVGADLEVQVAVEAERAELDRGVWRDVARQERLEHAGLAVEPLERLVGARVARDHARAATPTSRPSHLQCLRRKNRAARRPRRHPRRPSMSRAISRSVRPASETGPRGRVSGHRPRMPRRTRRARASPNRRASRRCPRARGGGSRPGSARGRGYRLELEQPESGAESGRLARALDPARALEERERGRRA